MGREEEHHYAWLAKVAKLKWRGEDEDEDRPGGMAAMVVVESVGGILDGPSRNAANDIAVQLALLLLVLLLFCANSRAKLIIAGPFLREIRGPAIWWAIPVAAALLLALRALALFLSRCQNDHLPTAALANCLSTKDQIIREASGPLGSL